MNSVGRSAVVTGAAQGIGARIARRLAETGAHVALVDRDVDRVKSVADDLTALGHSVFHAEADVTDMSAMRDVVARVCTEAGRLDVMVNNAGIVHDEPIWKMSWDDFRKVIDVNLGGTWVGTKVAMEVMREQDPTGGSIVNVSSIAGKVGNFGQTNYSAAKAGVVGLSKAAAKEGARRGVRVNVVRPGLIETAMTAVLSGAVLQEKLDQIPLGRAGTPDDVADAILFLASEQSAYMTGNVLEVAGGRFM